MKKGHRGITLDDLSPAHRAQAQAQMNTMSRAVLELVKPGSVTVISADLTPPSKKKSKPRGMNKWEGNYAQLLEFRRLAGEIKKWRFEDIRLRLADGAWYKIDFFVMLPNGDIEFHEVKGKWQEAARVRHKVAREKFAEFTFRVVRYDDGSWKEELS